VVLHVQDGQYAVPIGRVQEIVQVPAITRLPRTQADVEGVINLRGHVLPVIDLAKRLGLGATERDRRARVVVVQRAADSVGLLVDGVSEVLRLRASDLEPSSQVEAHAEAQPIQAVAKVDDRLILLLDLEAVLGA
jgi:purine-binding chemotaxis protein CheW